MTRYWISWWEPTDSDAAVAMPPGAPVRLLGAWDSGSRDVARVDRREAESQTSVCALVESDTDGMARYVIESTRTVVEWRFLGPVEDGWTPGDRFPMSA